MAVKLYDANQVNLTVCGISINSGRADGDFLKIEAEEDAFTAKSGADGEVTRSRNNNTLATATVTLMQTSDSNAALSALLTLDTSSPNGAGVGKFIVEDKLGVELHTGTCWVMKTADKSFGKEAGTREWKIQVAYFTALGG